MPENPPVVVNTTHCQFQSAIFLVAPLSDASVAFLPIKSLRLFLKGIGSNSVVAPSPQIIFVLRHRDLFEHYKHTNPFLKH